MNNDQDRLHGTRLLKNYQVLFTGKRPRRQELARPSSSLDDWPNCAKCAVKQTAALATKLDKDNRELKAAPSERCRQRIARLASGAAEPVFKNILENEALEAALTRPSTVK